MVKNKTIKSTDNDGEVFTITFTDKTTIRIIGGSSSGWGMVTVEYYDETNNLICEE